MNQSFIGLPLRYWDSFKIRMDSDVYFHKPAHGSPGVERQLLTACFEKIWTERKAKVIYRDTSWENWHTRVMNWEDDGQIHLVYIPEVWLPELVSRGILTDLSECAPQYIEHWKRHYTESIFRVGAVDHHQYGIPAYGAVWCFMYNAELLQEVGFSSAPKSWNELRKCAILLKKRFPELIPYGINDDSDGHFADHGYVFLFAGGQSDWKDNKGKISYNHPWIVKGLTYLQDLVNQGLANVPLHTPSQWIRDEFMNGRIAMTVGPSDWILWQREHVPKFPLRVAMMPCPKGGEALSYSSYGLYGVISSRHDSSQMLEVMEVLQEIIDPPLLQTHVQTIGMLPVQKGAPIYENDNELSVFSRQARLSGRFPKEMAGGFPELTHTILSVLRMEESPVEALRGLTRIINREER